MEVQQSPKSNEGFVIGRHRLTEQEPHFINYSFKIWSLC